MALPNAATDADADADAAVERLADHEWTPYVTRESTVLWRYLEHLGYTAEHWDRSALDVERRPFPFATVDDTIYHPPTVVEGFRETASERVDEDPQYLLDVAAQAYRECERYLDVCAEVGGASHRELDAVALAAAVERYCRANARLGSVRFVYVFDRLLDDRLDERFDGRFDERYAQVVEPERPLPFARRRRRLLELAVWAERAGLDAAFEAEDDAAVERRLRGTDWHDAAGEVAEEFGWVETSRYLGSPTTVVDVVGEVRDLLAVDPAASLADLERERADRRAFLDDLATDATPENRRLLRAAERYAHLRSYRMDAFEAGNHRVRSLLTEVGRRLGLPYRDVVECTGAELVDCLRGAPLPDDLAARREAVATVSVDGEFALLTGDDVERVRTTVGDGAKSGEEAADDLHGRGVVGGTATGPVRVVRGRDDVERVEAGDVVVSPMTTPHMTPALERAAAVVTDEGGMLCHAAVIARELGTPCVVGTGRATEALADGDRVTVDADAGVVRV